MFAYVTPVIADELAASPFGGMPTFFPVEIESDSVAVAGLARVRTSRLGSGEVYSAHRGQSTKVRDAILADSADKLADVFVSDDNRCRQRFSQLSSRCSAVDYSEFQTWVRQRRW
jgi:hypothetical protein